ncbi:MAG: hypothetical protein AAB425_05095 [Bdellovibrionota bacterium]
MPAYKKKIAVSGKSSTELYEKIATGIDYFLSKYPLGKHEVVRDAGTRKVHLKSSMVTLELKCLEGEIHIEGSLSFIAMAIKGKLDDGIDRWIAKTFGSSA